MTWALLAAVLGVAVVDSINPSALAMTTLMLAKSSPYRRASAYIAGIFFAYFTVGAVVLVGGSDVVDQALVALARPEIGIVLELLVGIILLVLALRRRRQRAPAQRQARAGGIGAAFVTGVGVTAVEATTALPYLGALALLVRSDLSLPGSLLVLALYNLVFVLPPVALVALHRASPSRAAGLLERVKRQLGIMDSVGMRVLAGVLGAALTIDAVIAVARGWDPLG